MAILCVSLAIQSTFISASPILNSAALASHCTTARTMASRFLIYARLVRLPNVFTAMADIGMGALVVSALPQSWLAFLVLLSASSCLYLSGMVWNDFFDIEQDRRERPFRPLPSGRVSRRTAALLAMGLMLSGLVCALLADLQRTPSRWDATIIAAVLAGMILVYDGWAKRTWLGPLAMGSCRALNVLLGLSIANAGLPSWSGYLAAVVGLYIVGVTWFARTEARESNRATLQAAAAVLFSALALALALPVVAAVADPALLFPYLLVGFAAYLAIPIARAIRKPVPERVQAAVKRAVLGLVILDAVLATAIIGVAGLSLIVLLIPATYLGKWVYST